MKALARVLVVEDDGNARTAMGEYLQSLGYLVSVAACFSEAIERADAYPPDVLLCDWKLDGDSEGADHLRGRPDGVDTAADLQRRYPMSVILVTGRRLEELQAKTRGTSLKVDLYRRKPLSLPTIASDIALLVAQR